MNKSKSILIEFSEFDYYYCRYNISWEDYLLFLLKNNLDDEFIFKFLQLRKKINDHKINNYIFIICLNGNLERLKNFHTHINFDLKYFGQALMTCCQEGYLSCVKYIFEDILSEENYKELLEHIKSSFILARRSEHIEIVNYIINKLKINWKYSSTKNQKSSH